VGCGKEKGGAEVWGWWWLKGVEMCGEGREK